MWLEKIFLKIKFRLFKRHRLFSITFLLLVLIFFTAVPLFSSKLGSAEKRAQLLRSYPVLTKVLPLYWKIRKTTDIVYFPYFFRKNQLPTYELIISEKDQKELDDSLPKDFMNVVYSNKVWVPAKFIYDGKTYDVKVRYRGDNAVHWNAPKKSYLVNFKSDDLFKGIKRLSFIIIDDRHFVLEQLNNKRAKKLSLFVPDSWFGNLKINGKKHGLYFIIESWSQEMLAKAELPDETNFYSDFGEEDLIPEVLALRNYGIWDNLDRWTKLVNYGKLNFQHYTEVKQLLTLLNQTSDQDFYQQIFNLIDQNNFYAWQIHQELIHSNHQTDDVRLYFSNTSGKFYFIPWDLGNTDPSFEIELYGRLAKRIFSNPVYLSEKNKRLYQYLSDEKNLEDDLVLYDQAVKEIKVALYQDRLKIYTNHCANNYIANKRKEVIEAIDKLKEKFNQSLVFVEIGVANDNARQFLGKNLLATFDIYLKSYSDLYFKKPIFEFNRGFNLTDYQLYFENSANEILDNGDKLVNNYQDIILSTKRDFNELAEGGKLILTKYRFYLVSQKTASTDFSNNLKTANTEIENAMSGKLIPQEEISAKLYNEKSFKDFSAINNINAFERNNPFFQIGRTNKQIILASGNYQFNKTVIVPAGFILKIMAPATLQMAPCVSLISYSPVQLLGTASQPINFVGQNYNQPWGVFAVINAANKSLIQFSNFSGGKDDYINGIYFSGMVSIYHSDVRIENSFFSRAFADDSINVKNAVSEIVSSDFRNNSADAIDYDFIKEGMVADSRFFNNGNDSIDLSGSTVVISGNFIEKSGDKCVSIGEKSLKPIIYNNVLNGCDIGVAIKDLSEALIVNNVIINNRSALEANQKKPVFGGGFAKVYNSIIWNNQNDIVTDPLSKIEIFNSNVKKQSTENKNFDHDPAFNPDFTINQKNANLLFTNGGNAEILNQILGFDQKTAPVGLNR